jgi:hypothetical protein
VYIRAFHSYFLKHSWKSLLFVVPLMCLTQELFSQQTETLVKAVAFEKISLFINWPDGTDNHDKFIITVLGENPFGNTLEQLYKDKTIKGKKVVVNYITTIKDLGKCDILYISKMKISELKKIVSYAESLHVLTISDTYGFAEAGCFINLYEFDNKLRFEINQRKLLDAGFTVDYRLLRVSKVINPVINEQIQGSAN